MPKTFSRMSGSADATLEGQVVAQLLVLHHQTTKGEGAKELLHLVDRHHQQLRP